MPRCPACLRNVPDDQAGSIGEGGVCAACLENALVAGPDAPASSVGGPGAEAEEDSILDIDLSNPPAGAWYRDNGSVAEIGSVMRSPTTGFFLLFGAFWNAITWLFVIVALSGGFGGGQGVFLGLFLTPFVLVGLGTGWAGLSGLLGKTTVLVSVDEAVVSTGMRPYVRRKAFVPANVVRIRIEASGMKMNNQPVPHIAVALREGKPVTFGTSLSEERRRFVAGALAKALGVPARIKG